METLRVNGSIPDSLKRDRLLCISFIVARTLSSSTSDSNTINSSPAYRIVTSANQLVEKIQIFDAGKDDRVMELVKLLVTDSLHENNPDKEFDELRFAVDDGTNILVIINKGEITGAVDIDS